MKKKLNKKPQQVKVIAEYCDKGKQWEAKHRLIYDCEMNHYAIQYKHVWDSRWITSYDFLPGQFQEAKNRFAYHFLSVHFRPGDHNA